jgi:hypothetical protein
MLKPLLKILVAGTVGFLSIIGGYVLLAEHDGWLPTGVSNTTLIGTLVIPIPVGLFIAWVVYRVLDRL